MTTGTLILFNSRTVALPGQNLSARELLHDKTKKRCESIRILYIEAHKTINTLPGSILNSVINYILVPMMIQLASCNRNRIPIIAFLLLWLCIQCFSKILTRDDYRVIGLEEIEPAFTSFHGNMYAGLIPTTLLSELYNLMDGDDESINGKNAIEISSGKLMFWLYEPYESTYTDTIVTWMNGGPGCSSLAGCLFEHCPVTVPLHPAGYFGTENDPMTFGPNPYAWTNATKMLYIEQPHNTGFGSGPDPQNETQVGHDVYIFLQNFYTIFDGPKNAAEINIDESSISSIENGTNEGDMISELSYIEHKLFMFGESYAGMYVPSIAWYIHEQNIKINPDTVITSPVQYINLNGIGIGNGWIDPMIQAPAYVDFLFWHGMIDKYTSNELHRSWGNCMSGAYMSKDPYHPFNTPDECGLGSAALMQAGDGLLDWGTPNVYDLSTFDLYSTIGGKTTAINQFYNNPKVQDALNAPHKQWIQCSGHIDGRDLLAQDRPISMLPYIATLLDEANIRVLIYNGDRDYIGNHPGSELSLNTMRWSGSKGWADTKSFTRGLYINAPKSVGGYIKQYQNLNLLAVYNSGHMVPYNRPDLALDLLTRFIGNISFIDVELPHYQARHFQRSKKDVDPYDSEVFDYDDDYVDPRKRGINDFIHSYLGSICFLLIGLFCGVMISCCRRGKYEGYEEINDV